MLPAEPPNPCEFRVCEFAASENAFVLKGFCLLALHPNHGSSATIESGVVGNGEQWLAVGEFPLDDHHAIQQIAAPFSEERRSRGENRVQILIHSLKVVNERPITQSHTATIGNDVVVCGHALDFQRHFQLDLSKCD